MTGDLPADPDRASTADDPLPIPVAEVAEGFDRAYRWGGSVARILHRSTAYSHAVGELLMAKGLITEEELSAAVADIAPAVGEELNQEHLFVALYTKLEDKYSDRGHEVAEENTVDCAARWHACQGACCRLQFPLSPQDINENVARWDLANPYWAKKRADGWCIHQEPDSHACGIYEHRPAVCRTYNCREDTRIWADFEGMVVQPDLFERTPAGRRSGDAGSRMDQDVPVAMPTRKMAGPVSLGPALKLVPKDQIKNPVQVDDEA